jgi:hypothetical protein
LAINLENVKDRCQVDTWRINSVTVTNGGRGYSGWFGQFVNATWAIESGGVTVTQAGGRIRTKHTQPTINASVSGPGTGASFSVTLQLVGDPLTSGGWRISSINVSGITSGYVNGSPITFDIGDATASPFAAAASAFINTDESGAITSVTVQTRGFFAITGVIDYIEIFQRGSYYFPDPSLPAYVRPPNVTVVQADSWRVNESGAQVTATVDGDPASPTFGQVTGLTLANAGNNYLAWYRDAIEYLGGGQFALGTAHADPQPGWPGEVTSGGNGGEGVPRKGCWVSGDGISFGTRVTDLSREILDYGEPSPPKGCCDISYDTTATGPFGSCGSVQQRIEKVIRTEQECNDREAAIAAGQCFSGGFGGGSMVNSTSNLSKAWTECTDCNGNPINTREMIIDRTYSGRWIVTVSPAPEETPPGCVSFCGGSGLCGPFAGGRGISDERPRFGEDNIRASDLRRMCVRWVCRCYEGTGRKNQFVEEINPETGVGYTPEEGGPYFTEERVFPDPYDWYTVESTAEVGGPIIFGGSLTEKLEAATRNYFGYEKLEHDWLFGDPNEWQAGEGSRFCLVYAFVFYGTSQKAVQDRCNFPNDEAPPGTVTPKDVYQIYPCDRCSCQ